MSSDKTPITIELGPNDLARIDALIDDHTPTREDVVNYLAWCGLSDRENQINYEQPTQIQMHPSDLDRIDSLVDPVWAPTREDVIRDLVTCGFRTYYDPGFIHAPDFDQQAEQLLAPPIPIRLRPDQYERVDAFLGDNVFPRSPFTRSHVIRGLVKRALLSHYDPSWDLNYP